MLKRSRSLRALIFLSGTLALTGVACSNKQTNHQNENALPSPLKTTVAVDTLHATSVHKPSSVNSNSKHLSQYDLALDKAHGAVSISQSAQSADDWQLVASQWQEAIALLQALPNDSPYKAISKTKIAEYQRHLLLAQQQANKVFQQKPDGVVAAIPEIPDSPIDDSQTLDRGVLPPPVTPQEPVVFQAAIKRRVGGTPVINVTFNGNYAFEMIVDTGASGTVLTQQTANVLGLVPVATARANTASAKAVEFPIGYVNSIQVGGVVVKHVPVAIAPASVLETGLLGHDFFGNYDVTIKRDVVEFRPR